jgi:hypothetical protein
MSVSPEPKKMMNGGREFLPEKPDEVFLVSFIILSPGVVSVPLFLQPPSQPGHPRPWVPNASVPEIPLARSAGIIRFS